METEVKNSKVQTVDNDVSIASNLPHDSHQSNPRFEKKLSERRKRWEWNIRLGVVSVGAAFVLLIGGTLSYLHHSSTAADTFRSRAEEALQANNYKAQMKWLHRCAMLEPNNIDLVFKIGVAADEVVNQVDRSKRDQAVNIARKELSLSIARLGQFDGVEEKIADLRTRLIERLLELGGSWFREAEEQVILANADPRDPQATKWLAMALYGQTMNGGFQERQPKADTDQVDPWTRLAYRPIGEVLAKAVDCNPGDIELIAGYLNTFQEHPEFFEQSSESVTNHQERIDELVAELVLRHDSYSRLVLHSFLENRAGESGFAGQEALADANTMLMESAAEAAGRLATMELEAQSRPLFKGQPGFVWDYLLLSKAALLASKESPEQAERWYELLMKEPSEIPDPRAVEEVFVGSGYLQLRLGNTDRAIEIWERGLKIVSPNSLELLGLIASQRSQRPNDDLAGEASERYRAAVEMADRQLAMSGLRDRAERAALGRQISLAKWRMGVVRGLLAARDNNVELAIALLTEATSRAEDIPVEEQIRTAKVLAGVATRNGDLDRAANAFESVVKLAPDNETVLLQAADLWKRVGNQSRADQYYRILGKSKNLASQIASIEALFESQLRFLPAERDFSSIRSGVARIGRELDAALASADQSVVDAMLPWVKRFRIVEVSLPGRGVSVDDHFESGETVKRVVDLADQYPSDTKIQVFAAEHLAIAGESEKANAIIDRLEKEVGLKASAMEVLRSRIESMAGDPLAAGRRLVKQAELDPDAARQLLKRAAFQGAKAGDTEFAYSALKKIPEDELLTADMFQLAKLARLLPKDSQLLVEPGGVSSGSKFSQYWQERIRKIEGDNGTYAKCLTVSSIVNQLVSETENIKRNDPRIVQARQLLREVLNVRPRWGEAISLEGWLFSLENRHELAIVHLRRGINAGDGQMSTQGELLRQLMLAGRDEEAEQQILRISFLKDSPIDEYGETRISLAARRGDINHALEIARASVLERPDDYLAQLVLGRTATAAAGRAAIDGRQAIADEAKEALAKSAQLAGNEKPAVFAAEIRLAVMESNFDAVKALRRKIVASDFDEYTKAMLESQCCIALKDWQSAEALLLRADQLQPTAQTRLALAAIYRQTGQSHKELQSMRDAQQRAPENAKLRGQLALALAARDAKDVNWAEIESLLANGTSVTSASRLLHAVIIANKGEETQRREANAMLRAIIDEENQYSDDAIRVLAAMLRKRIAESADSPDEGITKQWISEARMLYQRLADKPVVVANDLVRQADFLLSLDDLSELPQVKRILRRLESMEDVGVGELEIAIRYATSLGEGEEISDVVDGWVEQRLQIAAGSQESIYANAGNTLIRNGFADLGLQWYAKAYQKSPETMLANYVVVLTRLGRDEVSAKVCLEHHEEFNDVESAALLAEVLMNRDAAPSRREEIILQSAVSRFDDNTQLLESVATLRMLQEDFQAAIPLFRGILKNDPFRIRTLNNLAMAYSEIPDQAAEGIEPINQAIKLVGEVPELLDTKGVVLLKAGRFDEAIAVFGAALSRSEKPRYQFHIVLTLVEQKKMIEAEKAWQEIDLERLDPSGLTAAERRKLEQLKKEFAAESTL